MRVGCCLIEQQQYLSNILTIKSAPTLTTVKKYTERANAFFEDKKLNKNDDDDDDDEEEGEEEEADDEEVEELLRETGDADEDKV